MKVKRRLITSIGFFGALSLVICVYISLQEPTCFFCLASAGNQRSVLARNVVDKNNLKERQETHRTVDKNNLKERQETHGTVDKNNLKERQETHGTVDKNNLKERQETHGTVDKNNLKERQETHGTVDKNNLKERQETHGTVDKNNLKERQETHGTDKHEGGSVQEHTSERIPDRFNPSWWKNHTDSVCKSLGLSTNQSLVPVQELSKILVDDKHKLLYCQMAKVASTNFGKIFAIIAGLYNGTNPEQIPSSQIHSKYNSLHRHLDSLPLQDVLHRMKHYFKFMFVREPFERVLSAFRNKFSDPPSSSFTYLSRKLVRVYRANSTVQGGVTFEEFLRYLVDPSQRIPTNPHWQPFYQLCRPCEVQYDFIAKLTTFNEDTRHILKVNGLTELVNFTKAEDTSHSLHKTDQHLKEYYSPIPKSLLQKLYKIYYPDYAIFDIKLPLVIEKLMKKTVRKS